MNRAIWLILFGCCLSIDLHAETPTLGLYLRNAEASLHAGSIESMRLEVQRLFEPAGVRLEWKDYQNRKAGEDFNFAVVGSIQGSCAPAPPPMELSERSRIPKVVSLGESSISKNEILPFFIVKCSDVVRVLHNPDNPSLLGRALARVIGHELYHILSKTRGHRTSGLAKAVLFAEDLVNPSFGFDMDSLTRINRVVIARSLLLGLKL
jgi:hypothetical protein